MGREQIERIADLDAGRLELFHSPIPVPTCMNPVHKGRGPSFRELRMDDSHSLVISYEDLLLVVKIISQFIDSEEVSGDSDTPLKNNREPPKSAAINMKGTSMKAGPAMLQKPKVNMFVVQCEAFFLLLHSNMTMNNKLFASNLSKIII